MGEMVSLAIHIGDRLGLHRELARHGSSEQAVAADELARRIGLNQRLVTEWLRGQAAAGLSIQAAATGLSRMTAPRSRSHLVSTVLPRIDGLVARLESGIRVLEVGCGGGVALAAPATRFPASQFVGLDPSAHAVALARRRATDDGAANMTVIEGLAGPGADDGADSHIRNRFDLILAFD
jgi:SAM-dependent methyltransferase